MLYYVQYKHHSLKLVLWRRLGHVRSGTHSAAMRARALIVNFFCDKMSNNKANSCTHGRRKCLYTILFWNAFLWVLACSYVPTSRDGGAAFLLRNVRKVHRVILLNYKKTCKAATANVPHSLLSPPGGSQGITSLSNDKVASQHQHQHCWELSLETNLVLFFFRLSALAQFSRVARYVLYLSFLTNGIVLLMACKAIASHYYSPDEKDGSRVSSNIDSLSTWTVRWWRWWQFPTEIDSSIAISKNVHAHTHYSTL